MHPIKVERHNLPNLIHTDPKGFPRAVRDYRVLPFGLYFARDFVDHPRIASVQAFLIPSLNIQINRFEWHQTFSPSYSYYLDIVSIEAQDREWHTEDYYLDILLYDGQKAVIDDTDEYWEAFNSGLLSVQQAELALLTCHNTVNALAQHGYSLDSWLSSKGIALLWQDIPRAQWV